MLARVDVRVDDRTMGTDSFEIHFCGVVSKLHTMVLITAKFSSIVSVPMAWDRQQLGAGGLLNRTYRKVLQLSLND